MAPSDQSCSVNPAQSGQVALVPSTVESSDPDKVKHDGGKTDVDAIRERDVGCKTGVGNWYRVGKQVALAGSMPSRWNRL